MILINPGSGPVEDGSVDAAKRSIERFVAEVGDGVTSTWLGPKYEDDGRFAFQLRNSDGSKSCVVWMPGLEPDYLLEHEFSHRLYDGNGSSWLWRIMVGIAKMRLSSGEEE